MQQVTANSYVLSRTEMTQQMWISNEYAVLRYISIVTLNDMEMSEIHVTLIAELLERHGSATEIIKLLFQLV